MGADRPVTSKRAVTATPKRLSDTFRPPAAAGVAARRKVVLSRCTGRRPGNKGHKLDRLADADPEPHGRGAVDDRDFQPAATAYKRDECPQFGVAVGLHPTIDARTGDPNRHARANVPGYVRDEIAERVYDDHLATGKFGRDRRLGQCEARPSAGLRPQLSRRHAEREVPGGRGKNVAAMKRGAYLRLPKSA